MPEEQEQADLLRQLLMRGMPPFGQFGLIPIHAGVAGTPEYRTRWLLAARQGNEVLLLGEAFVPGSSTYEEWIASLKSNDPDLRELIETARENAAKLLSKGPATPNHQLCARCGHTYGAHSMGERGPCKWEKYEPESLKRRLFP